MIDQRLVEYLKEGMNDGISLIQLKNDLLGGGWSEEDVREAMDFAMGRNRVNEVRITDSYLSVRKIVFASLMAVAIVAIVLVFAFNQKSSEVVDFSLVGSGSIDLSSSAVQLRVGSKNIEVSLGKVYSQSADIIINDEPLRFNLDEDKSIDLDNDGENDIIVRLDSIKDGTPRFYFEEIGKEIVGSNRSTIEKNIPKNVVATLNGSYNESIVEKKVTTNISAIDDTITNIIMANDTTINDTIEEIVILTKNEACQVRGKFYFNSSYNCDSMSEIIDYGEERIECCYSSLTLKFTKSQEFNGAWDSMIPESYCTQDLSENIRNCLPIKCIYTHPLVEENYSIGVVLDDGEYCHIYSENMMGSYEYCKINSAFRDEYADYYASLTDESYGAEEGVSISLNWSEDYVAPNANAREIAYINGDCQFIYP